MNNSTPTSVYKYYDEFGLMLYAGVTGRGVSRQFEHAKSKSWWKYVASQSVEHFMNRELALSREYSLIKESLPPFNAQHNPDHEGLSEAYLRFRQTTGLDLSPIEMLNKSGGTIPLELISRGESDALLATKLEFAPVIALLEAKNLKAHAGSVRCGNLISVKKRGVSLGLEMTIRKNVIISDPFMRVKMLPTKQGITFIGHNIQIANRLDYVAS